MYAGTILKCSHRSTILWGHNNLSDIKLFVLRDLSAPKFTSKRTLTFGGDGTNWSRWGTLCSSAAQIYLLISIIAECGHKDGRPTLFSIISEGTHACSGFDFKEMDCNFFRKLHLKKHKKKLVLLFQKVDICLGFVLK